MRTPTENKQWTNPFYGVQHLGQFGTRTYWATVEDHGSFATLRRWFPGCQFHPHESTHDSLTEAKTKGQRWVTDGVLNAL